jgi:hypothetical protein
LVHAYELFHSARALRSINKGYHSIDSSKDGLCVREPGFAQTYASLRRLRVSLLTCGPCFVGTSTDIDLGLCQSKLLCGLACNLHRSMSGTCATTPTPLVALPTYTQNHSVIYNYELAGSCPSQAIIDTTNLLPASVLTNIQWAECTRTASGTAAPSQTGPPRPTTMGWSTRR